MKTISKFSKSSIKRPLQTLAVTILACTLFACQPTAEFELITMQAYVGVPVEFQNLSDKATSYKWDFGDGRGSTAANPKHTYSASGTYSVTLEAIRGNKSDLYNLSVAVEFDLEQYVQTWGEDKIPGLSVAFFDNTTGVTTTYTAGQSHEGTPIDDSMLFSVNSQTETFTAVLCMKLVEQDLISLDDVIGDYLPDITNVNPNATIRQLLQHNSGLDENYNDFLFEVYLNPAKEWTYSDIFSHIALPNFEPGEQIQWHVINPILLGNIVEVVTGKTYKQLIHEWITVPLELENTYVEAFDEIPNRRAHPWFDDEVDHHGESRTAIGTALRASWAIVSTPSDMVNFYNAVFNDGFLSDESINQMSIFKDDPAFYGEQGLGIIRRTYNGTEFWFHPGVEFGYHSFTIYDPGCGDVISIATNGTFTGWEHFENFAWNMIGALCEE